MIFVTPPGIPKHVPLVSSPLKVERLAGFIWSHVRKRWLVETPEESVRQTYLAVLVNEYKYGLEQIDEELEVTGRGSGHARADFVIWRTGQDKRDGKNPLIVVECKSDNVKIAEADYGQGDNYSRLAGARFFVTHNTRETRYWRVVHEHMPKTLEEIENVPTADASNAAIEELVKKLKVFREDEFATLLHRCHNIIRNREKKDPAAAFDEIAKILFVKVWVERELKAKKRAKNVFTVEYLDEQIGDAPLDALFDQTKSAYRVDEIFSPDDRIKLKPATAREIVRSLERYNLSDTSEDVKGIAFERFLGRTFRGEIGQFFTPRPIVEFMIRMIDPREGEIVCDPASGSGGFLIRFFEIVRELILADADRQYAEQREEIQARGLEEAEEAAALLGAFAQIQSDLDPSRKGSRLWKLANECVYGTDANDRMARTSKMNMIMHGDGHGGVHHHDGLINVNGIFEGRFDVILTNPPFGATVEATDYVDAEPLRQDIEDRYVRTYGQAYVDARSRLEAATSKPIVSMFELPRGSSIKTELLFIERCLNLLKAGGRLGIVLPEGVFNNSSLAYVRDFVESRAYIRAVVSLPEETFKSSKASVKASLLFLEKFDSESTDAYLAATAAAKIDMAARKSDLDARAVELDKEIAALGSSRSSLKKDLTAQRRQLQNSMNAELDGAFRRALRARFDYPIFMYDADQVGIGATGQQTDNELYPNARVPLGVEKTALELYQEFLASPHSFAASKE